VEWFVFGSEASSYNFMYRIQKTILFKSRAQHQANITVELVLLTNLVRNYKNDKLIFESLSQYVVTDVSNPIKSDVVKNMQFI